MNIYFDTEFTGLVPNTTLISLGCVSESGSTFYAEFTDYDRSLCDKWISDNVIENLYLKKNPNHTSALISYDKSTNSYEVKGTTENVAHYLRIWLSKERSAQKIQFISDVSHYDFYLLSNQIFGGASGLPDYVNPVCIDICQDLKIPTGLQDYADRNDLADCMYKNFDYSREKIVTDILNKELPEGRKHNSLYDAKVIKIIFEEQH